MTALDQVRTLCRSLSSGLRPHPDVSEREWRAWLAEPVDVVQTRYCPRCGDRLVLRDGPRGEFWGCSAYPACRHTERAA